MSDVTRPLIGITTYVETTRFLVHDTRAAVVPWAYTEQVAKAGGRPVLIPPMPDGGVEVLDGLDGLIVAGGADVEPARYGETPDPKVYTSPLRDAGELPLVRIALKTGLPLLGVCRGMQVMTVASGGRLHQHLPDDVGQVLDQRAAAGDVHQLHAAADAEQRHVTLHRLQRERDLERVAVRPLPVVGAAGEDQPVDQVEDPVALLVGREQDRQAARALDGVDVPARQQHRLVVPHAPARALHRGAHADDRPTH